MFFIFKGEFNRWIIIDENNELKQITDNFIPTGFINFFTKCCGQVWLTN